MYISDVVGNLIGSFIEWGFLMAFLLNLVTHINKPDKRLVIFSYKLKVPDTENMVILHDVVRANSCPKRPHICIT